MATREDLIDAGVRLLEADGLSSLTLRKVARAAGVSHGAPRHYFPTFGSLLAAIARRGVEDLDVRLDDAFGQENPRAAISRAAVAYVRFAQDRPEMFELISRHDLLEGQGGELRAVTTGWLEALADCFERATGEADGARVLALWSGVHGLGVLFSRRTVEAVMPVADVDAALQALIDAFVTPR